MAGLQNLFQVRVLDIFYTKSFTPSLFSYNPVRSHWFPRTMVLGASINLYYSRHKVRYHRARQYAPKADLKLPQGSLRSSTGRFKDLPEAVDHHERVMAITQPDLTNVGSRLSCWRNENCFTLPSVLTSCLCRLGQWAELVVSSCGIICVQSVLNFLLC